MKKNKILKIFCWIQHWRIRNLFKKNPGAVWGYCKFCDYLGQKHEWENM